MKLNSPILNFSDSEFMAFLYSERERENNLNQYQGWNNWVLIVALISTLLALYFTCRSNTDISASSTFYFISSLISIGFSYKSILDLFRKERACDFTRVRLLKDIVPWVDIVFIILSSITLSICSYSLYDRTSSISLVWSCVFIYYTILLIFEILYRKRLTPVNLSNAYFSKLYQNIIFSGYFGAFWSILSSHSFRMAGKGLWSVELEVASYVVTVFFLMYFIVKINFTNKVVKEFDLILDRYLYQGESKENTFNMILMNRMGYGVLEVCYNEWKQILTMLKQVEKDKEIIIQTKEDIQNDNYDISNLALYYTILRESIHKMEKILKATQKLSERLDEFVKISEDFDRDEVEKLFKTNEIAYSNIDEVCHKISELKIVIQAEIDKYYCNRIGVLCKKGCEHRADKMSWCDRYRYNYLNLKTCYLSRKHS